MQLSAAPFRHADVTARHQDKLRGDMSAGRRNVKTEVLFAQSAGRRALGAGRGAARAERRGAHMPRSLVFAQRSAQSAPRAQPNVARSEERRVGKEGRSRWLSES